MYNDVLYSTTVLPILSSGLFPPFMFPSVPIILAQVCTFLRKGSQKGFSLPKGLLLCNQGTSVEVFFIEPDESFTVLV